MSQPLIDHNYLNLRELIINIDLFAFNEEQLDQIRKNLRTLNICLEQKSPSYPNMSRLTKREFEVAKLVASAKTNKEVAHELGLSCKTVEKHRASIMGKLEIKRSADLIKIILTSMLVI